MTYVFDLERSSRGLRLNRFLHDLIRGTTVSKVRHMVRIPVLLLRAQ